MELPSDETGPVPVHYAQTGARYYGVTPTTLVLVLAAAALTLAIVLFALGAWPFALIAVGAGVLLVLVFLEAARRKPEGPVARSTAETLDAFRARAGVAADSLATRGRATRQLLALRRELQRMQAFRTRLLLELGAAVYGGDEEATAKAREELRELDELAMQREGEMQSVIVKAQDRLQRRRLEVQPTEMVELPDGPDPGQAEPGGPAVIPEPYPPPDEGNPPEPAILPEPGPLAPDESPQEGRGGA